jgi:sarcosine oxidase, subunit beta
MKNAETVIIGAGVVGASIAYHLTKLGAKDVLLIEREATQGRGSTGAATGGVRAQFETDVNIKMSVYALNFFNNWDHDCGYEPRGYLFFATTPEHFTYIERNARRQTELGVKDVDVVDTEQIKEIVPGMNCDDIVGGSFGANDGFIDPIAVMRGFTKGAEQKGARLALGVNALSLELSGGRITGVMTDRGTIECENVVICTGAWAKELANTAGVNLPVEPMRRQIVWARSAAPLPQGLPMVIDLGTGFHFRPAKGSSDELMFAYPDPEERPSFNTTVEDAFIDKVRERAKHRAAWLYDAEVIREKCRAGLYENTPDHHAILGGCDVAGLYFANGFSGHGVMHSPATGRALAEIILEGKAGFLDVSELSIERFKSGKLLHETAFI